METFKKILGVFIVMVGVGDITMNKSWFWGCVLIAIGLSLLIIKWRGIVHKERGKKQP